MTNVNQLKLPGAKPQGPAYALVEVLIHELANPVQAARMAVHLWQSDHHTSDDKARLQGLDLALDRVATVIRTIQTVKESILLPPAPVSTEKLLADLENECATAKVNAVVSAWPSPPIALKMHAIALPVLLASWASMSRVAGQDLNVSLLPNGSNWVLQASLREGGAESVVRQGTATNVAGYPAAIGEFMMAAGGSTKVMEDDTGTFELDIEIATWSREEID